MTGEEFSQKPFSFPRGTRVKLTWTPIGGKEKVVEECCFYGLTPIFGNCSSDPDDFAPVFRAVAKNGKMSNRRPQLSGGSIIFRMIDEIDFADTDEKIRVWTENWGKDGILVCKECGSTDIRCKSWLDANTNNFISDCIHDTDDNWCQDCERHGHFCKMSEFEKKMNDWFNGTDFRTMEKMFDLRHEDFDEEDGYQAFVDECEKRWEALSYESKRCLYNVYNNR